MAKLSEHRLKEFQANLMLNAAPEKVRKRVLTDREFTYAVGIRVKTTMDLSPKVRIGADRFVEAVRVLLSGIAEVEIRLESGKKLRFRGERDTHTMKLSSGSHQIVHPFIDILSIDRAVRLKAIDAFEVGTLPAPETASFWRSVLDQRPMDAAEYMRFVRDYRASPEMLLTRLEQPRSLNPATMVPLDLTYWSTLLPLPASENDFESYLTNTLHPHFKKALELNGELACSRMGYAAVCPEVVPSPLIKAISVQDLEWCVEKEDPFSLLFAFEVAADRLQEGGEWGEIGTRAITRLIGDTNALTRRCELIAAGVVIAFERLSQLQEWKQAPLYWRRLAAFCQAGVIADALSGLPDPAAFRNWAFTRLGTDFMWHSIVDRREAPLWWTDGVDPSAFKAYVASRFLRSLSRIDEQSWPEAWKALAKEIQNGTLTANERVLMSFPAPMADFTQHQYLIPSDVFEATRTALQTEPYRIKGLMPYVHVSQLSDQDLLLLEQFVVRTSLPTDKEAAFAYVSELLIVAHAAGVSRSTSLADRLAERALPLFQQVEGNLKEIILTVIVNAANAYATESDNFMWLARWFDSLAHRSKPGEEVVLLIGVINALVRVNPKYRAYLSRALAVLRIKAAR